MLFRGGRLDDDDVVVVDVLEAIEMDTGVVEADTLGDGVDDILSLALPECGVVTMSMLARVRE